MHVVIDSADDNRLALHAREDAAEVAMKFLAQRHGLQKGLAIFR